MSMKRADKKVAEMLCLFRANKNGPKYIPVSEGYEPLDETFYQSVESAIYVIILTPLSIHCLEQLSGAVVRGYAISDLQRYSVHY